MNYLKIYVNFFTSRINLNRPLKRIPGYAIHHITPRAYGGDNNSTNLVSLSNREHYFAHLLLYKIYGNKMAGVIYFMRDKDKIKTSRLYSKIISDRRKWRKTSYSGSKHHFFNKHLSEEHRRKISESSKNKIVSKSTRDKLSKSNIGKKHSEKSKRKMSIIKRGKKYSDYTKKKKSDTIKLYDKLYGNNSLHNSIKSSPNLYIEIIKLLDKNLTKLQVYHIINNIMPDIKWSRIYDIYTKLQNQERRNLILKLLDKYKL